MVCFEIKRILRKVKIFNEFMHWLLTAEYPDWLKKIGWYL